MKKMQISLKTVANVVAILAGVLLAGLACAKGTAPTAIPVASIQKNLGKSVGQLAIILSDVSLIAGVGFVMASFFKFHQHKLNPTQVPISQGITLLMIGAGLLLFPVLLPTATKAAFGTTAIAKTSGGAIKGLIGAPT